MTTAWCGVGSCWPSPSWRALAGQDGKAVKTLHAVFARPAKADAPLDITVERMHSGRSLASSTVTISQDDQIITRALALLSAEEPDVIRHADSPRVPRTPTTSPTTYA